MNQVIDFFQKATVGQFILGLLAAAFIIRTIIEIIKGK